MSRTTRRPPATPLPVGTGHRCRLAVAGQGSPGPVPRRRSVLSTANGPGANRLWLGPGSMVGRPLIDALQRPRRGGGAERPLVERAGSRAGDLDPLRIGQRPEGDPGRHLPGAASQSRPRGASSSGTPPMSGPAPAAPPPALPAPPRAGPRTRPTAGRAPGPPASAGEPPPPAAGPRAGAERRAVAPGAPAAGHRRRPPAPAAPHRPLARPPRAAPRPSRATAGRRRARLPRRRRERRADPGPPRSSASARSGRAGANEPLGRELAEHDESIDGPAQVWSRSCSAMVRPPAPSTMESR